MQNKLKTIFLSLMLTPTLFGIDINQELSKRTLYINQGSSISQTFKANKNNLYEIRFYVNKPDLNVLSPMTFTLKDGPVDGKSLFQLDFDAKNIGSNYWLRLTFPPQKNSKGKTYTASIEAPELTTKDIEIGYDPRITIPNSVAFQNNEPLEGNFAFRTLYRLTPPEFISESLKDAFFRLNADKPFFLVYLFLIVILLISFLYQFKKQGPVKKASSKGKRQGQLPR